MSDTTTRAAICVALAALAAGACARDAGFSSTRASGMLIVSLDTPHADDGAVLVSVSGGDAFTPVALDPAVRLFVLAGDPASGETRVAVLGHRLSGPLFAFQTSGDDDWTASVIDAADTRNRVRENLTGYVVHVDPQDALRMAGSR